MDLSDTKIEITNLISGFESLWTGVTHPNKYKDRMSGYALHSWKNFAKYISVYINVMIVEILKYDMSYMRYYIVIAIREFIIIFWIVKW